MKRQMVKISVTAVLLLCLTVTTLCGGFAVRAQADTERSGAYGALWELINGWVAAAKNVDSGQLQSAETQQPESEEALQAQSAIVSQSRGSYSSQVFTLVNGERQKRGLPSLQLNRDLDRLAQLKAEDLAQNNLLSHTSPTYGSAFDMMQEAGLKYRYAGENIARGQTTAKSVMNGWMASSGHRANILSAEYTEIGIGCAKSKSGKFYWVQIFRGI